jgi:hypothetical protein
MDHTGKTVARRSAFAITVYALAFGATAAVAQTSTGGPVLTYAAQGWSEADRDTFYTTSQGSRMIQYSWFRALRRLDVDEPFAADRLQRYGYLPNNRSKTNPEGLPVGFVIDGNAATGDLGMTCAACHTAQLEYQKDGVTRALRLDGAPANADFQPFLTDFKAASQATLNQPDRFNVFAKAVLGAGYTSAKVAQLKIDFGGWVKQFGEFMDASLPASPWGPGRLDAFGMIFNRVAARDLRISKNFKIADAPVSYPFLWHASRQDHTQWNGGVPNGLYIQALARNTGEVFGVFGVFKPMRPLGFGPIIYSNNSADFDGLQTLEEKIAILKPPPWPRDIFGIDDKLAERGKPLFEVNCGGCHGEHPTVGRPQIWITTISAAGTDPKMVLNSGRSSDPGLFLGAPLPPPSIGLVSNPAKTHDILAKSVIGSILDGSFIPQGGVQRAIQKDTLGNLANPIGTTVSTLSDLFKPPSTASGAAYESRVLHGIWATAPYLHNGSVPNLWELLTPPKKRNPTFMVGSRVYDPVNVGYRTDQSPFKNGAFAVDPMNANGNGNGGHDYGTTLSDDDRWAIIEYLKTF